MPTDWIAGLVGGLMIGCGGAVLLLLAGRVMGASGLIGGLVDGSGRADRGDRLAFLAATAAVPLILSLVFSPPDTHLTTAPGLLIVAGLCVGLGTRLANGCTSGHGVCGLSRLSPRGALATALYIGAGVATVALMRAAGVGI